MEEKDKVEISRMERLTAIARLYYEQDMTQNEIAKRYGVSRPLISRMLKNAKEAGIVKVEICPPYDERQRTMERAMDVFGLRGGAAAEGKGNDNEINDAVCMAALSLLRELKRKNIGIGWGHIIGNLVTYMEKRPPESGLVYRVCPLIGNSGVGNRNYHSNELVRVFAQQCQAAPEYFYAPFLVTSEQEREVIRGLESCQSIEKAWENLDAALVNIGNYPSVPDFASEARYGDALRKGKAVGKILNYYLDGNGKIFQSDKDYAMQIPLDTLAKVPCVIGICSANTGARALAGALKTGLIHYLAAPEPVLKEALDLAEKMK